MGAYSTPTDPLAVFKVRRREGRPGWKGKEGMAGDLTEKRGEGKGKAQRGKESFDFAPLQKCLWPSTFQAGHKEPESKAARNI